MRTRHITVEEIKDLFELPLTKGTRGKALSILTQHGRRPFLTTAQESVLRSLLASEPAKATFPAHPEEEAVRLKPRRENDAELTAIEIAWVQRLPHDPAQVSFNDASQLAALAGSINSMKLPASHRLIQSIWQPVKELHDMRQAEAGVQLAERPLEPLPSPFVSAIADSLKAELPPETPGIDTESAAFGRFHEAQQITTAFDSKREERRARQIDRAKETLLETQASQQRRIELTRDTVVTPS